MTPPSSINPIPFNKPFIAGKELFYIAQAVIFGNVSGDGYFTDRCCEILKERLDIQELFLTTSCTSALEMAAMLCDLGPGDEVLMPSFTFVSTANAFVRTGATPVFIDIREDTLNIDENLIEAAITPRTRAIVPVHYGGVGCEMNRIMEIAAEHDLRVIEDAAQAVNAFYDGKALGTIGDLGCYSFHETKNYICGEGGALCLNDPAFVERAEIVRDKGTNRKQFFRGHVDKYTWVDIGSSYVLSEILSAFLCGQLEELDSLRETRQRLFERYFERLKPLAEHGAFRLPTIPSNCQSNYHNLVIRLENRDIRDRLMTHLNNAGISAVFHYIPLHSAPMGIKLGRHRALPITEDLSFRILRLPFYYELREDEIERIATELERFFGR